MFLLSTAGSIILSILIFIVAISVIVAVHEAGHLAAAKIFGVYCFDYSIGFGPKIFRRKRKDGETYFSLRAIPIGGFVSMYGEGDPAQEEKEVYIPPSRSLNGISHPKKFVVMGAGVFLNFILGFLLLLFANTCLNQMSAVSRVSSLSSGDSSYIEELRTKENNLYNEEGKFVLVLNNSENTEKKYGYTDAIFLQTAPNDSDGNNVWIINEVTINETQYYLCRYNRVSSYSSEYFFNEDPKNINFFLCELGEEEKVKEGEKKLFPWLEKLPDYSKILTPEKDMAPINFTIDLLKFNSANQTWTDIDAPIKSPASIKTVLNAEDSTYRFSLEGDIKNLSVYFQKYKLNFVDGLKNSGSQFGNSCALIFKTLGSLFTPKGFNNVGGPIKIVQETSRILTNFNPYMLFYFFGVISINLGIVNLLPFPGLDGWHLFVCIFEGITRKDIPSKAKNVISIIGLVLLFALAGAILVKDIIGLF